MSNVKKKQLRMDSYNYHFFKLIDFIRTKEISKISKLNQNGFEGSF